MGMKTLLHITLSPSTQICPLGSIQFFSKDGVALIFKYKVGKRFD